MPPQINPVDQSLYTPPTWNAFDTTATDGAPAEQIQRWAEANPQFPLEESDSGLFYHILEEGNDTTAIRTVEAAVFYRGSFVDGVVFDQTRDDAAVFLPGNLIEGFAEGLELIGERGRVVILVPPALGYGPNGRAGTSITGSTVLVFELTLEDVDPRNNPIGG